MLLNRRSSGTANLSCSGNSTTSPEDVEAVKRYRKAAAQGDAGAQNNLGVRYANGRGVAKDDREAVSWYRKAAAQGHAGAKKRLAVLGEN